MEPAPGDDFHRWRFVTNHAHVLETIARDPTSRLRDIALTVGITERTVAQIIGDLIAAGYLTKFREGRRNRYDVHERLPLRHPQHRHHTVGELIRFLNAPPMLNTPSGHRPRAGD
jgi:winged helix DNA-binding protein